MLLVDMIINGNINEPGPAYELKKKVTQPDDGPKVLVIKPISIPRVEGGSKNNEQILKITREMLDTNNKQISKFITDNIILESQKINTSIIDERLNQLSGGKFNEIMAKINQRQNAIEKWQQDSDPSLFMIIDRIEVMDGFSRRLDEITENHRVFEARTSKYDDQIIGLDALN